MLDLLRNRQLEHAADAAAVEPFVSSEQLRDTLLQGEPSVRVRALTWAAVERVVKRNTNVQENEVEFAHGGQGRAWTWTGDVHAAISYEDVPETPA